MRRLLFVDTSGWYAAFNRTERHHAAVKEALQEASAAHRPLVTSDYILDETLTLIRTRAGHRLAVHVGEAIWRLRGAEVVEVDSSVREAAWNVFVKYNDHELSFTDCTSAAVMRLRGIDDALTLDEHFRILGFDIIPSFRW